MDMSITEAKARLTDLVRRAEAGEDIVLTRHGQPAVRLVAVKRTVTPAEIDAAITRAQDEVAALGLGWPNTTSDHGDLYDEFGLPT